MLSRWSRLFVAFAAALAVWAIATPAWAAAPLCDPRGATGIAPAPQLQQPETSIDVGVAPDECALRVEALRSAEDGRAPEPRSPSVASDPVASSTGTPSAPATFESVAPPALETPLGEQSGVRSRVDRPPCAP
jgi:hypothetical protein